MLLVKSHNYVINIMNCAYFRASKIDEIVGGGTTFKMVSGPYITITCDYDTVMKQISNHYSFGSISKRNYGNVIIELDY